MDYLENYIKKEEEKELKEMYNENIIKFIMNNQIFIIEKLEYLKKEGYIIYPILKGNIRIFLEIMPKLKKNIEKMKRMNLSKKHIQMILMDEKLYEKLGK